MSNEEYKNSIAQIQKDMKELKWESRIQTLLLLIAFVFGVMTIKDLLKEI